MPDEGFGGFASRPVISYPSQAYADRQHLFATTQVLFAGQLKAWLETDEELTTDN
jgi:hypothetical protein